ncbi:MAG: hypothetical protein IT258_15890, partial [Saprospiraceae bacterium]|nr:hypothetical protein [Saprospiraceae bacterium]
MVETSKFSFSLKFKILFIVLTVNLSFIACHDDASTAKTMEASFRLASNTLAGEAIDEKRQIRSILSDEAKAKYSKTGETLNSIDSSYFPTKDRLNRIQQAFLKESMNQSQVSDSLKSAFVLIKGFIEDAVNSYSNLLNESGTLYGLREAEIGNLVQKMKIRKDSTLLLLTPTKGFESMLWLAKCEMDMER